MSVKRVLVAMSGGVDSSVTAFLLKQQGYDCIGATMLLHGGAEPGSCGSGSDADDAAAIARRLGFPHEVIDLRTTFEQHVVSKFVQTYEDGRTPNPCIDCNRHLKFGALLDRALELGCDFISTGHYARVSPFMGAEIPVRCGGAPCAGTNEWEPGTAPAEMHGPSPVGGTLAGRVGSSPTAAPDALPHATTDPCVSPYTTTDPGALLCAITARARETGELTEHGIWALSCGVDPTKDQSYVLYSLTQERLARVLLPLGGLFKERDVRRIAAEQGFENAAKRDSQGICFVPQNDFASYIERLRGHELAEGDVLDAEGRVIGRHHGAIRYTIGQRKGLGVACAHPVYVTGVDAQANTVTLGERDDLLAGGLIADDWIWSAPSGAMESLIAEAGAAGLPVCAKIRYRHASRPARLTRTPEGDAIRITFNEPEAAIAPGQAVVVYAGPVVLGGGTVRRALPRQAGAC